QVPLSCAPVHRCSSPSPRTRRPCRASTCPGLSTARRRSPTARSAASSRCRRSAADTSSRDGAQRAQRGAACGRLRCSAGPPTRRKVATMYVVIRAYAGNSELADTLAAREDDIRQVIAGIDGFKAYYLLKLAEGTSSVSVFEDQEGAEE